MMRRRQTLVVCTTTVGLACGMVVPKEAGFRRDGFAVVEEVLSQEECEEVKKAFSEMFEGRFDSKVYPDEWYGRGASSSTAVREIVNGWKASDVVARIALRPGLGRLACELMGWDGARLAQDDCVWKPAGGGPVGFHCDAAYISDNLVPRDENSMTLWIALDAADAENGVLEYARGSHAWPRRPVGLAFHGTDRENYRAPAIIANGGDHVEFVVAPPVPAGSALAHHQDVFHGSGPNFSTRHRRALVLHFIRHDVHFRTDTHPDYIYGRYVLHDEPTRLRDDFFPLVFANDGRHLAPGSAASRRLKAAGLRAAQATTNPASSIRGGGGSCSFTSSAPSTPPPPPQPLSTTRVVASSLASSSSRS